MRYWNPSHMLGTIKAVGATYTGQSIRVQKGLGSWTSVLGL